MIRNGVNSIDVHPSGRIALSVGKDHLLKMWNLLKGNCGYTVKLKGIGEQVCWNKSGTKYAILFDKTIIIYDGAVIFYYFSLIVALINLFINLYRTHQSCINMKILKE